MGVHVHMTLDVGYASDVGSRENQEDNLGFRQYADGSLLAVLSDGMGGHVGGEVASEMAVRLFGEYFPQTKGGIPARLTETLHYTHQQLCRQAQVRPELKTMGATLIAVFVCGTELYWASVGDSLLYVVGKAGVVKINAEHTVRARFKRLWEANKISQAEFETVEEPHALTSALGPDKLNEIDGNQRAFHRGEVLILASDGLLGLELPEINALIDRRISAQVIADRLLRATLEKRRAGQDNIGIVVIKQLQRQVFTRSRLLAALGGVLLLGASAGLVYQVYQSRQLAEQERLAREQTERRMLQELVARQQAEQRMHEAKADAKQAKSQAELATKRADHAEKQAKDAQTRVAQARRAAAREKVRAEQARQVAAAQARAEQARQAAAAQARAEQAQKNAAAITARENQAPPTGGAPPPQGAGQLPQATPPLNKQANPFDTNG